MNSDLLNLSFCVFKMFNSVRSATQIFTVSEANKLKMIINKAVNWLESHLCHVKLIRWLLYLVSLGEKEVMSIFQAQFQQLFKDTAPVLSFRIQRKNT